MKDRGDRRFVIQRLTERELEDGVRLSARLGWDYTAEEINLVLKTGILYGQKDERNRVIATAAIMPYRSLASLGLVMVDPDWRKRGLATRLIRACLQGVADRPVMLVSTGEAESLYEGLGFQRVGTVHKLIADRYVRDPGAWAGGCDIQSIRAEDHHRLLRLDREALGVDRGDFLRHRMSQASHGSVLKNRAGQPLGYALGVRLPEMLLIGPVVAPDPHSAGRLIDDVAGRYPGRLRIDILSGNPELLESLTRRNFQLVRNPPVMMQGGIGLPYSPRVFALAAQAYG